MLKIIEGCTCAGKTTRMAELVTQRPDWIPAAEHTPAKPGKNDDLCQRQWEIFAEYLHRCEQMRAAKDKTYIADFSPLGCIAFCRALYRLTGDKRQQQLADEMAAICRACDFEVFEYLTQPAPVICQRLKERARNTDDAWSEEFIKILVEEYNKLFIEGKEKC